MSGRSVLASPHDLAAVAVVRRGAAAVGIVAGELRILVVGGELEGEPLGDLVLVEGAQGVVVGLADGVGAGEVGLRRNHREVRRRHREVRPGGIVPTGGLALVAGVGGVGRGLPVAQHAIVADDVVVVPEE
jgi:hypothetical protein